MSTEMSFVSLPGHSSAPQKCPVLADCKYPGQSAPDWSWLGLFMMLLMLVLLLIALEYLRAAGRRSNRSSTAEDEVMQLISSVGFQVGGVSALLKLVQFTVCVLPYTWQTWNLAAPTVLL